MDKNAASKLSVELSLPPQIFIVLLVCLGIVFVLEGDAVSAGHQTVIAFNLAIICFAASILLWGVSNWWPTLGRWLMVVTLVIIVHLLIEWTGLAEIRALIPIPVAIAVVLLGFPAGVVAASGQTAILILAYFSNSGNLTGFLILLISIWAMLGISYAAYYSSHQLAGWTWEYFTQARSALEEDRERQGELRKALDDLAHANRQLMLLNENLADLRLAAEQAERAKTAFLSRVSHEFRTPLNMIIGLTDLFFETPQVYGEALPQKLLEHMAIVHRNCQHLAALVDDVLDLSQVEAGRLALQKERFNLGEVVDKMTAIVRPLLEKKRIELLVEVENELPSIFGDRRRISQVVVNLLSNAARFTSQGEVRIRVMSQDGNVVVSVSDTGPGIAIEDKKAIFEPFCHGISGTRGEQGGSGLGLSISKQFVDLHGGQIWLESELGVGSTFYFSIPVDQPLRVTGSPGHWIIPEWVDRSSTTRLASVRLAERLVVLDEGEAIHPVLSRFSDETEYVLTKSLEEAVAEVQRCPAHALLVNSPCPKALIGLLLEARQQLRELPLIGCSVRPSTERATVMGASGYLIKPVTRDKLQQAVLAIGTTVKRILIVDDGADDREVLSLQLRAIDDALEIETIASGEEALEVMRVRVPDLVLLDIIMPQMDGWQVLTLKQEDAVIRHIPVILVSAEDPQQRPITGELIVGTIGQGLSVNKLLDCSQALAALLKRPS